MYILLDAIITVAMAILNIYFFIVLISAVMTWFSPDPYNPLVRVIRNLTDPVFRFVGRAMPFLRFQGIDFTPLVVLVALQVIMRVLAQVQFRYITLPMQVM